MTTIKKTITSERLAISASFLSGGKLNFSIGRSGERLSIAFSFNDAIAKLQSKAIMNWIAFMENETNLDRINRLEELCRKSNSGSELIKLMKQM
jgi:hypothetical protein